MIIKTLLFWLAHDYHYYHYYHFIMIYRPTFWTVFFEFMVQAPVLVFSHLLHLRVTLILLTKTLQSQNVRITATFLLKIMIFMVIHANILDFPILFTCKLAFSFDFTKFANFLILTEIILLTKRSKS